MIGPINRWGPIQWKPGVYPPPTVFVSSLPGGGRMFIGTRACSMERIESAPQCCPASAPRSVPTRLQISWKLGMASRHSWKRLRSICFMLHQHKPPFTLDRRRPPPAGWIFFGQRRFPVGGISSWLPVRFCCAVWHHGREDSARADPC